MRSPPAAAARPQRPGSLPGPGTDPGPGCSAALSVASDADPELVDAASKFVSDLLERAQQEASRRARERSAQMEQAEPERAAGSRKRGRWHSRARGLLLRVFASLCLCNSNGKGS